MGAPILYKPDPRCLPRRQASRSVGRYALTPDPDEAPREAPGCPRSSPTPTDSTPPTRNSPPTNTRPISAFGAVASGREHGQEEPGRHEDRRDRDAEAARATATGPGGRPRPRSAAGRARGRASRPHARGRRARGPGARGCRGSPATWPRIIDRRLAPPNATAGTRIRMMPARRRDSRVTVAPPPLLICYCVISLW